MADTGSHRILKLTPAGAVSTFAGSTLGSADGAGASAQFNSPQGLAMDSSNNLYVADTGNHRLRALTQQGEVSTVAGSSSGLQDGEGANARFNGPVALAAGEGSLLVADRENGRIRMVKTSNWAVSSLTLTLVAKPVGLAVDARGVLLVADETRGALVAFAKGAGEGTRVPGPDALDFRDALSLPVGPDNSVYLADTRNDRILRFRPN
ncbi:MAG: hypothetical protein VKS61_01600 [Candidatus Sericytochromatia bacterium]|nr:hypothetical protein [Candidatus Sericytochromatia bacterium]